MIIIPCMIFGGLLGALTARRHGGDKFDIAQYVVGFGILFAVIGLMISIIVERVVM